MTVSHTKIQKSLMNPFPKEIFLSHSKLTRIPLKTDFPPDRFKLKAKLTYLPEIIL